MKLVDHTPPAGQTDVNATKTLFIYLFFYKNLSWKCKLLNTIYEPSNSVCVIYICTALQNTESHINEGFMKLYFSVQFLTARSKRKNDNASVWCWNIKWASCL